MNTFMPWERFIDEKVRILARRKDILDVGGGERFQKWLAPYKELFADSNYRTFDTDKVSGADVVGDIHDIPLPDASVDAIICQSTLEHVRDPLRAMEQMKRILKPGGLMLFYVPSIYPYHARKGAYADYWRFFDDTIDVLFEGFSEVEIVKRGGYFTALSFFVPFQHTMRFLLDPLSLGLDRLFQTHRRTTTSGFYVFAKK